MNVLSDEMLDALAVETRSYVDERIQSIEATYASKFAALEMRYELELAALRSERPAKGDPGEPGKNGEVDYERLAEIVRSTVSVAVASLPQPREGLPGKDAVVDYDRIGEVIALAVSKEVAKLPPAKAGDPGKDADPVDYALIREFVNAATINAVAALPKPKDGVTIDDVAPQIERAVEAAVAALPKPEPGRPGKDVDMTAVYAAITLAVSQAVAALPKPEPGRPGKDVELSEVLPLVENAVAARFEALPSIPDAAAVARELEARLDLEPIVARVVAAIPTPKDGEDVHPDTVRVMVRDALEEAVPKIVALIPRPADGKSVDPADVSALVNAEVARQLEILAPHIKGAPGDPGKNGAAGWSPEDLELELKGERTVVVRLRRNGETLVERELRLAFPVYRGLYQSGRRYEKGDVCVYGGSSFCALRDTDAPIGGNPPSPDWQVMAQRGRDAR